VDGMGSVMWERMCLDFGRSGRQTDGPTQKMYGPTHKMYGPTHKTGQTLRDRSDMMTRRHTETIDGRSCQDRSARAGQITGTIRYR